jgi:transcriptional regulator with XRE-family HTH domain
MISENLRKIVKRKDWNQTKLSKESGIKQSYLSKIYNGKQIPTLPVFVQIADALGCTADELLGRS